MKRLERARATTVVSFDEFLSKEKRVLCIYHSNCADGFTSAWVVRRALGEGVIFHPATYQSPPPDVCGRDVLLVDFSYKRTVLEAIVSRAKSVLILDHHKTAQVDLEGLVGARMVFDMERSAARITWDYFFPDEEPPRLLLHVEDRDLWRFTLANTREIQANVLSYPYEFSVWDRLMDIDPKELIAEGTAIERRRIKDIQELLPVVTRPMRIGGHVVKVANLPYSLSSDAGHTLALGKPFGACYWDTPQGRVFRLRSREGGVDVEMIAAMYGGGGHCNASGFCVSFEQARDFEI